MLKNIETLIQFIRDNKDWEILLKEKPYCLRIKRHHQINNYVMFSYNMIESDFYSQIVRAARGCVLDVSGDTPIVVCHAFDKFGNYGEPYSERIRINGEFVDVPFDWNTSIVREKIDGSLIKRAMDFTGHPMWFTNNSFDIDFELNHLIPGGEQYNTFRSLINKAVENEAFKNGGNPFPSDQIIKDWTLAFELISPYNRVVVEHKNIELVFLGARNNITHLEMEPEEFCLKFGLHFRTPMKFSPSTMNIDELKNIVARFDYNQEGLVAQDKNFNRLKVKGEAYLTIHRSKDNDGKISLKTIFESIQKGTHDDIRSVFPEYGSHIDEMLDKWRMVQEVFDQSIKDASYQIKMLNDLESTGDIDEKAKKKQFAIWVFSNYKIFQKPLFGLWNSSAYTDNYLSSLDFDAFSELIYNCENRRFV